MFQNIVTHEHFENDLNHLISGKFFIKKLRLKRSFNFTFSQELQFRVI